VIAYLCIRVQQVNVYSKLNKGRRKEIESENGEKVIYIRPETNGFNHEQAEDLIKFKLEGRTSICCIKFG